jgi:hypothetical protein
VAAETPNPVCAAKGRQPPWHPGAGGRPQSRSRDHVYISRGAAIFWGRRGFCCAFNYSPAGLDLLRWAGLPIERVVLRAQFLCIIETVDDLDSIAKRHVEERAASTESLTPLRRLS